MPLFYRARQSQVKTKEGKKLWHLSLVKVGKVVNLQELAEKISEMSSLTPGDVHNTVRNLMTVMRSELQNSRTVRLDGLGTFTMIARTRGKGVETEEDVNPNQVSSLIVHFRDEYTRPAALGTTRAILQGVQFEKASKIGSATGGEDSGSGDGGGGDIIDPTA